MTAEVLSRRTLNRVTLERQLLLDHSPLSATEAIEQLVGIQAQLPNSPYAALWSRPRQFQQNDLVQLLLNKQVVRIALMRSTIHLVTKRDCMGLRPIVQPTLDRDLFQNSTYGSTARRLPIEEVTAYGRSLLDREALTGEELGALLQARWPEHPPGALAYAMRNLVPLIQMPPRGIWGVGGKTRYAVADTWFGSKDDPTAVPEMTAEEMVLRYIGAFGPAGAREIQTWSGLTKLQPVIDSLLQQERLRAYRDEEGRMLADLADASLPSAEQTAPIRFLAEYDNLILSFKNETRIACDRHRRLMVRGNQPLAFLLIDGFVGGIWKVVRKRRTAVLDIEAFEPLTSAVRDDVETEGSRLLQFLADGAEHDIRWRVTS